jgi:hypothetical protein
MRNLAQTLSLTGFQMRPMADVIKKAFSAIRRMGGSRYEMPDDFGLVLGPNLVTNGTFDSATGWTLSASGAAVAPTVSGGKLTFNSPGSEYTFARQTFGTPLVPNRPYLITVDCERYSSGAGQVALVGGTVQFPISSINSVRNWRVVFTPSSANTGIELSRTGASGLVATFDNFAIQEVLSASAYIDSLGTQPVTAVADLVGLELDSMRTVGSNALPANFMNSSTGWVITQPTSGAVSVGGGVVSVNSADGSYAAAEYDATLPVVGRWYRLTFTVASATGGGIRIDYGGVTGIARMTPGTYTTTILATQTWRLGVARGGGTSGGTITSITVQEVSGNHATQATTANKPAVARVPENTVNLLSWSGDFGNSSWTKTDLSGNSWSIGASVGDPHGGTSAVTMQLLSGRFFRVSNFPLAAGTGATQALWVKRSASGGANSIRLTTNNTIAWNTGISTKFALTDEWQIVSHSGTSHTSGTAAHIIFGTVAANGVVDPDCVGNVDVYRAGLFTGSVTTQQIVDRGGIPLTETQLAPSFLKGKNVLRFDGSNDILSFGKAVMQQTADNWVTAAFSMHAFPTTQCAIFGVSSTSSVNPLVAYLYVTNTGVLTCMWRDDAGTATTRASVVGLIELGKKYVVTAARIGNTSYLWCNGVLLTSAGQTLGTTTVNATSIGALQRTSTTFFMAGDIFDLAYAQATLTESDRKTIEASMAKKIGVTL